MPANRNALIRYRALDACLTNRFRRWTLDDLIGKVAEALYEFEGIAQISRRTIQADLQMMRSDKLGYNAPIVVQEKKYYTYEDPTYSITNSPLSAHDLGQINEAVGVLKQFKGFAHFQDLTGVVQKLEAHVYATQPEQLPVVHFEKNDGLRGLTYLDPLYQAVTRQQVVRITYQSFTAREAQVFPFHIWWLKEFRNRWFAVGQPGHRDTILHLALDRMLALDPAPDVPYRPNPGHHPDAYYEHTIGVSVVSSRPRQVRVWVNAQHAPYIETKPLHPSQQIDERRDDGSIVLSLSVQHNFELERDLLAFAEGVEVLSPPGLRQNIEKRLAMAVKQYGEMRLKFKI
jgi:predicted DNA-binding transcriptional regulator YafY